MSLTISLQYLWLLISFFKFHVGLILMEYSKQKFKNLSLIPGSAEPSSYIDGCNLLKLNHSDIMSIEELASCINIDSRRRPPKRYIEAARLTWLVLFFCLWFDYCWIVRLFIYFFQNFKILNTVPLLFSIEFLNFKHFLLIIWLIGRDVNRASWVGY